MAVLGLRGKWPRIKDSIMDHVTPKKDDARNTHTIWAKMRHYHYLVLFLLTLLNSASHQTIHVLMILGRSSVVIDCGGHAFWTQVCHLALAMKGTASLHSLDVSQMVNGLNQN